MVERRVARRYARALIQMATTDKELAALREDVQAIERAIHASHDLRVFLRSPIIKTDKKKAALATAFDKTAGPIMRTFLQLLCDKRRERVLPEIVQEFELMYDHRMGIERPIVTSAVELGEPQKNALVASLAARLHRTIQPEYKIDPTVLAGVRIRIGDTVIDSSAVHQLESLRESMLQAT